MAGGSGGQPSKAPIVEAPAMLAAPGIHPAAADVSEFQAMASAFAVADALGAPPAGEQAGNETGGGGGERTLSGLGVWKVAWPFFLSALPALVTLIALSLRLFPWLEPAPPPEARSVTVSDLSLAERSRDLGDGVVANVVLFDIEAVGYNADDAADDIAVNWLVFDAATRQRLAEQPDPERWGVIVFGTRSDRVVGEIVVPPPANHAGCVFVRVQLQPLALATGAAETGVGADLMLDVADTPPFDPFDPANPECPDVAASGEAAA
jgi:hypothetical protein